MLLRAVLVWLLLLVLAILNGGLRESWIDPALGEQVSHVVSTLLLSAVIVAVTWVCSPWLRVRSVRDAWGVGVFWVVLTVAFEFLAGHYLFGHRWDQLLADYDVSRGRIWPLVLLADLVAPVLAAKFRGVTNGARNDGC